MSLSNFVANGKVRLTHFSSTDGLSRLDPRMALGGEAHVGSGLDSRTRSARNLASYKEYMPRIYFGVGVGQPGGYRKEKGLGNYVYVKEVSPGRIYDLDKDPMNVLQSAESEVGKSDPMKLFLTVERKIRDAGFNMYTRNHPSYGQVAVSFVPMTVMQLEP